MTIDEFKTWTQDEIDGFFKHYQHQNKLHPDMYPLEMDEEDWFENLLTIFN